MGSSHWQGKGYARFRKLYMADYPVCEHCNRRPSAQLHHVKQPKLGGALMARANVLALCYECHRLETLRQKRIYGRL